MALRKQTTLYEILIRFGPEGLRGAHVIDLDRVIDDKTKEVLSEQPSNARAVTVDEVGELLGRESASLIETISALTSRVKEAEALASALGEQLRAANDARRLAERAAASVSLPPPISA